MSSSPGLGARPGGPRVAVKMEAAGGPFYSDEGLELLPDFVFNAEGGPQVEEGSKMLLGASSKKGPFSSSSSSSSSMRPRGGLQHRLLPTESPLSGSGAEVSPSSGVVLLQPPLLKLPPASDLEQLLIQAGSPSSTSPTAPTAGAPFLYRTPAAPSAAAASSATASSGASAVGVTQEQEGFADGFVKALADLHKQNQLLGVPPPPPPPAPLSPTQPPHPCCPPARQPEPPAIYTTLGGYNPGSPSSGGGAFYGRALEEPQTVPETVPGVGVVVGVSVAPPPPTLSSGESPPPQPPPSSSSLSPLDAESQERLKAERKRLRNRIAASKCRRRKLERIARLEEKVKALKGQNAELAATASLLRAQVTQLQGRVRSHLSSGCHINAAAPAPSSSSSSSQTSGVVGVQPQGPPEPESSTC